MRNELTAYRDIYRHPGSVKQHTSGFYLLNVASELSRSLFPMWNPIAIHL